MGVVFQNIVARFFAAHSVLHCYHIINVGSNLHRFTDVGLQDRKSQLFSTPSH